MRAARAVVAAVTFLTRLPLGRRLPVDGSDVARGAVLFPLVGAGIGAAGAGVALLAQHRLTALVSATLAVAAVVALTGALHVDALGDTADGAGAATRERRLEIMRDSRLGTFGVAAIGLDLLLRVGAVEQLLATGRAVTALVAAGALSRAAGIGLAAVLPYPRASGGPGSVLSGSLAPWQAAAAVMLSLVVAVLALGLDGLALGAAVAATAAVLALWFRATLGGATGDSLGATTELGELAALLVAAALLR